MASDVTFSQVSSTKHTADVLLEMFSFGYLYFLSKILLQYIYSKQ